MKKVISSLPSQLLLEVVLGVAISQVSDESLMHVIVTIKYILNQVIVFCVPSIIIGFIAPSIARLGNNASKMLGVVVSVAYISSIGAALFFMVAGYLIIPHLSIATEVERLKELPEIVFQLDVPQIMLVMSALIFSLPLGLAATWTKVGVITDALEEFQQIALSIVTKVAIPILPVFIAFVLRALPYEGTIIKQLPVFIQVVVIVMIRHYIWMALLYAIGGVYSGKNPMDVIKNYGPAYTTAMGTMSSVATLAVVLRCTKKSQPPLRDDMVDFNIPLFANIHLCGSVLTEVSFAMTISKILYGHIPSTGTMLLFCALLGVLAIGAPGVPGSTVMTSLGLATGVLGFNGTGTTLAPTIFTPQDSFGTACNVIGNGVLTMILIGFVEKHGIKRQKIESGS